jgi:hypothetical protein
VAEVALFDSATAMLVALARCLHGREMPPLGRPRARLLRPVAEVARRLPVAGRQAVYALASGNEGQSPEHLAILDVDAVVEPLLGGYPQRQYPMVALGSSSGALVHLCAALGVPWLPQTLLLPVRQRGIPVDEPDRAVHAFDEAAGALLTHNPHLVLHHMHDPNQDRLTLRRMAYFRVKRTRLGSSYERFLTERLAPGGTILLAECGQRWPTTRIGERHVFQLGAVGGLQPDDYRQRWKAPDADGDSPEAEWGFEDALRADVLAFAERHGYRVRRLCFEGPEALSPVVADLYRWWYRQHGRPDDRLLVESFMLLDPWQAVRTASVPFWTVFPVRSSAAAVGRYLDKERYDDVRIALFCHGVESEGLATTEEWAGVMRGGGFLGVDPRRYPSDLGSFFGFGRSLAALPTRWPSPEPLSFDQVESFLAQRHDRLTVRLV